MVRLLALTGFVGIAVSQPRVQESTAERLATAAGTPLSKYCETYSFLPGCKTASAGSIYNRPVVRPAAPIGSIYNRQVVRPAVSTPKTACSQALTAEGFACRAGRTVEDYCEQYSFLSGCEAKKVVAENTPTMLGGNPATWSPTELPTMMGGDGSSTNCATVTPCCLGKGTAVTPIATAEGGCTCEGVECVEPLGSDPATWSPTDAPKMLGEDPATWSPTEEPAYDCNTKEVWTNEKSAWCCREESVGCIYTILEKKRAPKQVQAFNFGTTDPTCAMGILNKDESACCPATCGKCGGLACGKRPGGASACCSQTIIRKHMLCDVKNAPCVMRGAGSAPDDVVFDGNRHK